MIITMDSTMEELMRERPESVEILLALGLDCRSCPTAPFESVSMAAGVHGIPVDKMADRLGIRR